jgi:hypothetical protein
MSNQIISCIDQLPLPDLSQHIILEFLDYKLRNKKYIKQLSKYRIACFEDEFSERPEVEYFEEEVYEERHNDEDSEYYIFSKYEIQFNVLYKIYHGDAIDKFVVLSYSPFDRNDFDVQIKYIQYDYDGKHAQEYFPVVPW